MKRIRNWKTTVAGVAVLTLSAIQIVNNPASILDELTIQAVVQGLIGVGLITAADAPKER